jgi:16S rRNA pseudouridine516 synthase
LTHTFGRRFAAQRASQGEGYIAGRKPVRTLRSAIGNRQCETRCVQISKILFSQGFGTRRVCSGLVQRGDVVVAGRTLDDPDEDFTPEGLVFDVQGKTWAYHARALLMLHKPAGFECSRKPRHHPSVLTLLPPPLRTRDVQAVGRLDEDTTGLLLFTDDGALIHRLTSPKHHVPKVYEVLAKHAITDEQIAALLAGVVLEDDPAPVCALAAVRTAECTLRLTLGEGKYHQVKRMLAAVGNRVEKLHRSRYGALDLPLDLPVGQWRWVELAQLGLSGG